MSLLVLYLTFAGAGTSLPPLGPAFNPATGAWSMAADAAGYGDQTLKLSGLQEPVRITLEKNGTAHVVARTDHDLFLAVGYLHARFRLFQMDLLRRQASGRLSEVVGAAAIETDRFELQLGLLRTATAEWTQLGPNDPARMALSAYAQGVNDRIEEAKGQHQLPVLFKMLGYEPGPWSPVDSLLVKGDMTQDLDFTDTPLVQALLARSLGPDLTAAWLPVLPPNAQSPYDPGPYPAAGKPAPIQSMSQVTGAVAASAAALLARLDSLPPGLVARGGNSNNWAVSGSRSQSGGALLAGDPHLHLTLPAIWFQLTEDSPGFHTAGVTIPGTPVVLIGHNQHIAWSLTNTQNQATFFYVEKEDGAHPGQYFWQGAWHPYRVVHYDIPVKGGATSGVDVRLSVHGPVISERGQTTSVWWAGNLPAEDLAVLLDVGQAADFGAFREALRGWHAPSQNFVYADDRGNIGLISAGYYPLFPSASRPWLPMAGTGENDVLGTIPYDDIPQIYNPPTGIVWTANQRVVGADYPYYIGTAANFFDPGYRADEIKKFLSQDRKLSAADMATLQTDTRDYLAGELAPKLLDALKGTTLDARETQARDLLAAWDGRMDTGSAGATIWWYFLQAYLARTFDRWWSAAKVPVQRSELNDILTQDLEAWTLGDPANAAFSPPGGPARTAPVVMGQAFADTVSQLSARLGQDPSTWTWGRVHTRVIESLAQIPALSYGPRPDRGDAYTVLAAADFPSAHGPSWRMIVDWGNRDFRGIYPGGQAENPVATWYHDRVDAWWSGQTLPMSDSAGATQGGVTWELSG